MNPKIMSSIKLDEIERFYNFTSDMFTEKQMLHKHNCKEEIK